MITQTTDWGYSVSQQVKRTCEIIVTYSLFCRCYSIIQRRWRKTTPPILCWHYTAQNVVAKRPQPPRSVISIIIYPIPSDLGSQDDSSQASSTVGDHVRSPGTERFYFSACLIWRSTNTLIRSVFGRKIKASSNTFSPKILKRSGKGTWSLDCRKKLYFCPYFSYIIYLQHLPYSCHLCSPMSGRPAAIPTTRQLDQELRILALFVWEALQYGNGSRRIARDLPCDPKLAPGAGHFSHDVHMIPDLGKHCYASPRFKRRRAGRPKSPQVTVFHTQSAEAAENRV